MADVKKTIQVVFGAVDDTGNVFGKIGTGLSDLETNVHHITGPMADLSGSILKAETALAALGTAFVAFSLNAAGKFRDSTNEIYTLINASPAQFGAFRDQILAYAQDSTQSIEQINGAVYSAISAGISYQDALGSLAQAEKLSVAGKADLNATTVVLASTLNAYGESVDQAARYSDTLFTTVRLGQTTLPELSASLAQVTGIAASAGIPFETLAAAVADLTAKGLPTAQAITGIKAAISNILKPTKDAADAAAALGVEFNATGLQALGFDGLMAQLGEKTGGNTELMSKLFGSVEGLNAALSLSSNGAAGFIDKLGEMRDASGATEAAYAKMADNFGLINQKIANNVQAVLIGVGDELLAGYAGLSDSVIGFLQAIGAEVDKGTFDPLLDIVRQLGDDFAAVLDRMAQNLPAALAGVDFGPISEGFEAIKDAVRGLFDGLDLGKPEDLRRAIQGVIDVGGNLLQVTGGIVSGFGPLVEAIQGAAEWFGSLDADAAKAGGNLLGLGHSIDLVLPAVGGLGSALDTVGASLAVLAGSSAVNTVAGITKAFGGLGAAVNIVGPALSAIAGYKVGEWLGDVTGLGDDIYAAMHTAADAVGLLPDHLQAVKDHTEQVAFGVDKLRQITGDTSITVENFQAKLREYVAQADAADKGTQGLSEGFQAIDSTIQGMDFDALAGGLYRVQTSSDGTRVAVALTKEELAQIESTLNAVYGPLEKTAKTFDDLTGKVTSTRTEGDHLVKTLTDASGNIKILWEKTKDATEAAGKFDSAMVSSAGSVDDLAQKAKLSSKEAADLYVQLQKIAADKDIKLIEAKVQLDIAGIEADRDKFVAIFGSIDTTIKSTGDLLGSLFGNLIDAGNFRDKWLIEDQIEKENQRRDEALKLQSELTKAQIDLYKAKADAMTRGDALVKIEADGMEPEIEAFMWRILEKIQLRANADAEEFLLNVGGVV